MNYVLISVGIIYIVGIFCFFYYFEKTYKEIMKKGCDDLSFGFGILFSLMWPFFFILYIILLPFMYIHVRVNSNDMKKLKLDKFIKRIFFHE